MRRKPSGVVNAVSDFRAEVLRGEAGTMKQLQASYQQIVQRTAGRAEALAKEINTLREAGEAVSVGRLVRLERYQLMMAELGADVEAYGLQVVTPAVAALQEENVWLAQQHAAQIERIAIGDERALALQRAHILSPSANIEAAVGLMGNGQPVREYLRRSLPLATIDAVERAVADVVTGDLGPKQAARAMVREAGKASGIGLQRAMTITRTEALRVYRESQRQRWQESEAVPAYRRTAAQAERTCIACIAMDGAIMPIDEPLDDHVSGRCSTVPIFLIDGEVVSPWRGRSARGWLEEQPESTQLKVMGPGRLAAYKRGDVQLHEMARRVDNPTFGGAWVPRNVADIQAGPAGGLAGRRLVERTAEDVLQTAA